jgi:hypothetical protein
MRGISRAEMFQGVRSREGSPWKLNSEWHCTIGQKHHLQAKALGKARGRRCIPRVLIQRLVSLEEFRAV